MSGWGNQASSSSPVTTNPCYARLMHDWLHKNTQSREQWAEIDKEHTKVSDLNAERWEQGKKKLEQWAKEDYEEKQKEYQNKIMPYPKQRNNISNLYKGPTTNVLKRTHANENPDDKQLQHLQPPRNSQQKARAIRSKSKKRDPQEIKRQKQMDELRKLSMTSQLDFGYSPSKAKSNVVEEQKGPNMFKPKSTSINFAHKLKPIQEERGAYESAELVVQKQIGRQALPKAQEEECSICLTNIKDNGVIRRLRCNHRFHQYCIEDWFKNESNKGCPMCRARARQ